MNRHITDFFAFIKKNRVIIYVLLGSALMLQICSKGAQQPIRSSEPQYKDITLETPQTDVQQENIQPETPAQPQDDINSLLLMAALILGFFVAKRYGWLDKLFPKVVIFKVAHCRQKGSGNLILKVFLINKTKSTISFNNPSLVFFNGSDKREFIIKNIGGKNYFPITLTPGTGHKFNIDAEKFYTRVEGLKKYKTIQMQINSTTGVSYKSIKWPSWLTIKRM